MSNITTDWLHDVKLTTKKWTYKIKWNTRRSRCNPYTLFKLPILAIVFESWPTGRHPTLFLYAHACKLDPLHDILRCFSTRMLANLTHYTTFYAVSLHAAVSLCKYLALGVFNSRPFFSSREIEDPRSALCPLSILLFMFVMLCIERGSCCFDKLQS
jgi:hypothetical protein